MANAKEIKDRINSVKDTQKITKAMYLISSSKMSRAKSSLDKTRPYFNALTKEIEWFFNSSEEIKNKYFYHDDLSKLNNKKVACLVVTSDKGLAGAYNFNAIKKTYEVIERYPNLKLFVIGEYGVHYFEQHGINIEDSAEYNAQRPTLDEAKNIADVLLSGYNSNEFSEIFMVYTYYHNGFDLETCCERLLPFHKDHFLNDKDSYAGDFEFSPNAHDVFKYIMHSYISGYIYSALVDSFCSEQQARMSAMDGANKNADELLKELSIQYKRVRQDAITMSITEISAGATAQKNNHREE